MNNIPKKLRAELSAKPEYSLCMVTGEPGSRMDPIQWHHNMTWAGNQLQKEFCIIPVKRSIHDEADNSVMKEFLNWIMVNRMSDAELDHYSKAIDYRRMRAQLNSVYGVWKPKTCATPSYTRVLYPWLDAPVS